MDSVGVYEAKNRLSELLDEVEQGREVTITRHGKPVAKLVRAVQEPASRLDMGPDFDWEAAKRAAEELIELRKKSKPGPESLKDLINEGRRWL
ncbi:MAG TPA: type II toxin-antitoxin system prevent-host-death family antitoxin [Acidisphaera sp.]|nr:type II toxin-antitoxin system prevent-host-death family antitoxin [Acidisphaera sp.]